jgi:group I intron endonuclease
MGKPIIGVYKISNTLCPEGKYYIGYSCNINRRWGIHKSTLRGGYHCNIRMQRAYEKYGSDCFDYEILQECETEEEAKNVELSYLEDLTIRDKLYNLHYNSSGGDLMTYHPNKEQIIERMKNTQKEQISKMTKEERQERWGQSGEKNGMYGRTHTDEVKKRLSEINKAREPRKGWTMSEEHKHNLSKSRIGKYTGKDNSFFGKQHSEETKQKLRENKYGTIPTNAREILIDGELYKSVAEAGRKLKVCAPTIIHRIKSPNPKFANYFYADSKVLDDETMPSLPLLIVDDVDNREV